MSFVPPCETRGDWRFDMKKIVLIATAMVSALALGGCNSPYREDRAVAGAVVGGASGALIGAAATGRAGGALAGGLIGAAAGSIISAESRPRRCAVVRYDYNGNAYCARYSRY